MQSHLNHVNGRQPHHSSGPGELSQIKNILIQLFKSLGTVCKPQKIVLFSSIFVFDRLKEVKMKMKKLQFGISPEIFTNPYII